MEANDVYFREIFGVNIIANNREQFIDMVRLCITMPVLSLIMPV